jgi:predicted glycosyltransferase
MSSSIPKKIWVDLDNSPHVPFFNPIIRELETRGYRVILTVRDCFQVCGLAELYHLGYKRIGRHYGKNKFLKIVGTLIRSLQLLPTALKERPVLSVSHGSRSQLITAWMLRMPTAIIFDYEYTHGVGFIVPDWLIMPELVSENAIDYVNRRAFKYPGIKEDVYVPDFKPNRGILDELGLAKTDIVVTIRPPATEAHYHNPESEQLFSAVLDYLVSKPDVRMVILPRNEKKQTAWVKNTWAEWCANGKIIIPDHVVDGLNLIWHSDFVVSGGGTMNREAAALGVPVYSIFRGRIGAVDRYLAEHGRLTLIERVEDVKSKIRPVRRLKEKEADFGERAALKEIVTAIEKVIERSDFS